MFGRTSTTEAPLSFPAFAEEGRTAAVSILPGVPLPPGLVEPMFFEPVLDVVEPEASVPEEFDDVPPAYAGADEVVDYGPPPVAEVAEVVDSVLEADPSAVVLPDVPLPPEMPAALEPSSTVPVSTAVMVADDAPARRSFFGGLRRRSGSKAEPSPDATVPIPALGRMVEEPPAPVYAEVSAAPAYVEATPVPVYAEVPAPPAYADAEPAPVYAEVAAELAPPPYTPPAPPAYVPPTETSIPAFAHLAPAQQMSFPAAMEAATAQAAAARSVGLVYADGSHTELAAGPDADALHHVANVLAGEPGPAPQASGDPVAEAAPNE